MPNKASIQYVRSYKYMMLRFAIAFLAAIVCVNSYPQVGPDGFSYPVTAGSRKANASYVTWDSLNSSTCKQASKSSVFVKLTDQIYNVPCNNFLDTRLSDVKKSSRLGTEEAPIDSSFFTALLDKDKNSSIEIRRRTKNYNSYGATRNERINNMLNAPSEHKCATTDGDYLKCRHKKYPNDYFISVVEKEKLRAGGRLHFICYGRSGWCELVDVIDSNTEITINFRNSSNSATKFSRQLYEMAKKKHEDWKR